MKTRVLLLLFLCSYYVGTSQEAFPSTQTSDIASTPKFVLKTNLVADALQSFNLGLEYQIGPTSSVGISSAYLLEREVDMSGFLVDPEGDVLTYDGILKPSGFFITPYYRYYPSGAMTGFYAETFLRYYNVEYGVPYNYDANNGKHYEGELTGTADGFGGGIVLGSQFPIAENIYLDIFAGVGVANGNAHIETSEADALDAEDFAEIKKAIDENRNSTVNIFILSNTLSKVTADSNGSKAWADIESELFPLFRGGITIGFAF